VQQGVRLVKVAFVSALFESRYQALGEIKLAARLLLALPARSQRKRLTAQADPLVGTVLIEQLKAGAQVATSISSASGNVSTGSGDTS